MTHRDGYTVLLPDGSFEVVLPAVVVGLCNLVEVEVVRAKILPSLVAEAPSRVEERCPWAVVVQEGSRG